MSKEILLVAYEPRLERDPWLFDHLHRYAEPQAPSSILVVNTQTLHPILQERWPKRVVQFLENGERWVDGQCQSALWKTKEEDSPFQAMVRAAKASLEKEFRVRWVLLASHIYPHPTHPFGLLPEIATHAGQSEVFTATQFQKNLVWVDTETTGLAKDSAVIEICALLTDPTGVTVLDEFEVRATIPSWAAVQQQALDLSGYPRRWVDSIEHQAAIEDFYKWLAPKPKMAGHNTSFDLRMLDRSFRAYGLRTPDWDQTTIDTVRISREILGKDLPNAQLGTLRSYFGIDTGLAHSARADIEATRQIYLALKARLKAA